MYRTLFALPLLAACVPAVEPAPCTPMGCAVATETARIMQGFVGEDFGGGVVLRQVIAAAGDVVMDLDLPVTSGEIPPGGEAEFARLVGGGVAQGVCESPETRTFFDLGNRIRVRSFAPDGSILSETLQTSCG